MHHHDPPVELDETRNARRDTIYILNVDKGSIEEADSLACSEETTGVTYLLEVR